MTPRDLATHPEAERWWRLVDETTLDRWNAPEPARRAALAIELVTTEDADRKREIPNEMTASLEREYRARREKPEAPPAEPKPLGLNAKLARDVLAVSLARAAHGLPPDEHLAAVSRPGTGPVGAADLDRMNSAVRANAELVATRPGRSK